VNRKNRRCGVSQEGKYVAANKGRVGNKKAVNDDGLINAGV